MYGSLIAKCEYTKQKTFLMERPGEGGGGKTLKVLKTILKLVTINRCPQPPNSALSAFKSRQFKFKMHYK